MRSPDINIDLVAHILAMTRLFKTIVDSVNNPNGADDERTRQTRLFDGVSWLFALSELDSKTARLHPPSRVFLPQALSKLRPLLAHNAQQQRPLLDLLRRHPHLIPSLHMSVTPNAVVRAPAGNAPPSNDPDEFFQLFLMALIVKDLKGVVSVQVLSHFDVAQWLAVSNPHPHWRGELYRICDKVLREEAAKPDRTLALLPSPRACASLTV
jgi:hypothetical protein